MKCFLQIATEIGELDETKNAAYGSSFADAGKFLQLLYPTGIQPQQYDDALLTVRIFDKLKRIATDRDALGESPYRDIAGYGVLGAALVEQKRKDADECRTSAPPWDAETPQRETTGSAARNAGRRRTTMSSARPAAASRQASSGARSVETNRRKQRS